VSLTKDRLLMTGSTLSVVTTAVRCTLRLALPTLPAASVRLKLKLLAPRLSATLVNEKLP
jgi:hypothetical protein